MQMGTCSIIGTKTKTNIMEFTVCLNWWKSLIYIYIEIYIYICVMYMNIVLHNVYLMLTYTQLCKFLVLSCKYFFLNQTSVQISMSTLLWKKEPRHSGMLELHATHRQIAETRVYNRVPSSDCFICKVSCLCCLCF